jgi:hypothetical protein
LYAAIDPVTPSTTDFFAAGMGSTFRELAFSNLRLGLFSVAAMLINLA